MSFLIGLGIILALVYGNSLYDYLKERKAKKMEQTAGELPVQNQEEMSATVTESAMEEKKTDCDDFLVQWIQQCMKRDIHLFGLPLTFCEQYDDGRITAIDKEDNIYIVETTLRSDYDDLYDQTMADIAHEKQKIQSHKSERKVYGLVCTNTPSQRLIESAKTQKMLRIFEIELIFRNKY